MKARNIFLLFILLINFSFAHAETELPVLEKNSDEIVNENLLKPRSPHTKSNKYRKRMDDFEYHSADYNPRDRNINIRELLRVIQLYNYTGTYYCDSMSEDGYALGYGDLDNDYNCFYHSSDFEHYVRHPDRVYVLMNSDWTIDLEELMRLLQLYNSSCYIVDPSSEDGYNPCEENFRKKYKFFFNNQSKKIKRTIKNEPQSLIAYHKLRKQSNNQYRIESKIEYTGYLTAIAIQILKPSNCLFVDASDDVKYKEFEDHIDFFWKDVPVSPISFSYMIESQTALSKKQIDAIAYYRFGAGNEQSQEVIYEDASVLATHSSQSYTPGELLEISNHIEYKIDLSELTLNVNLADGWIIHSYTGNDLPDKHIEYQNQFIWNKVPESSIDFSYHVKIPEDENGINIIKANIIYKDLSNIENLLTALPYPLLIYEAIPSIDTNWNLINPSISVNDLRCLWGNLPNDVFAVGKFGDIIHYDGASWKKMKTPTNLEFYGVWGCSHNEVFAVGNKYESDSWLYLIYFYDGYSWNEMFSKESGTLKGVWGNSYFDVFTVGSNGVIYHFNGSMWEMMQYQTTENLNDVWGVPGENVYAVGDEGTILKYNGLKWVKEENLLTDRLNAIWGDSNTNIYTVGINGTILNFNGETWNKITNTSVELNDIWGSSKNDIYAVGSEGVIYYFDGNNWSETYNPLSGSHNRIESVWGDKGKVFASASNGIILFFDGKNWVEMSNITSHNLNSIFYVPDLGMVSAGDYGIILCNNDQKWSEMNSNTLKGAFEKRG